MAKSYLVFALPVMLLSITGIIAANIDKVMLGYFWSFKEVGYYFSVQRITILLLAIPTAVGTLLFPTISEYHARNNVAGIKEVTHSAERYISMVAIPLITIVIIFPESIINIVLSSAFLPAASTLAMLAIYVFILSLTRPYSSLIIGINRPNIAAKIGVGICMANIVLNYLFIPEWGLLSPLGIYGPVGAATATAMSQLVGFAGLRVAAMRLTGMKLMQTNTPRHIVAGVVMGIGLYYLNYLIPLVRWYHLIGFALVGIAVYVCVLFIIREFKKDFCRTHFPSYTSKHPLQQASCLPPTTPQALLCSSLKSQPCHPAFLSSHIFSFPIFKTKVKAISVDKELFSFSFPLLFAGIAGLVMGLGQYLLINMNL